MFAFAATGVICWILMFGAGHDLWHETGRVDLWRVPGVHAVDLGAFLIAFYGLLLVLLAQFAIATLMFVRRRKWTCPLRRFDAPAVDEIPAPFQPGVGSWVENGGGRRPVISSDVGGLSSPPCCTF